MSIVAAPSTWVDAPIPIGWVIDGQPHARGRDLHNARGGGVRLSHWDCTAGRFRWVYEADEMIQVLEGEAHITDESGHTFTIGPGDTAHFVAGTTLEWEVPEYIRKVAFWRNAQTLPDRLQLKARRVFARTG